ncbi:MAG: penicillin-binding protein 2 [Verrucomicrobiales bacterium]|nr:penicillin-binding protein 2 [Verrucomicrobiales bacterium]
MNNLMRIRALTVVTLFAIGFTVVSGRLVWLQVWRHEDYRREALQTQMRVVPLPAGRGRILDCQRRIYAQSVTVTDLFLDGKMAEENPMRLDEVAALVGLSPSALRGLIDPAKRHVPLARDLDTDMVAQLKALPKIRYLAYEDHPKRVYPSGREGSHVLGFTNLVGEQRAGWNGRLVAETGAAGVEKMLDGYLAGTMGERHIIRDRSGREIPAYRKSSTEPRDGCDVVLTIDQVIQYAVEEEADKLVEKYAPDTLSIIVTRPETGEILALTNRPTFDPNDRKSITIVKDVMDNTRNCAVADIYEPGSTFKIVTTGAVLSEGIATLDTPIFCENGVFLYAGATIRDTHPTGTITLRRALQVSSNIAFAKLGLALAGQAPERLYQHVRLMGFGQRAQDPRMALPGEQEGILRPPEKWSKLSPTHVPIGYEIGVTNLQMTMAMGAIANGGKLMRPLLVKSIVGANGAVVREFAPLAVRQVMEPEIAAEIRAALEGVVSDEGTAEGARVRGFTAAGKTGTARKYSAKLRGYEDGAYYSAFIGFVPADQPRFLISILVNRPRETRGQIYGGKVAGPAFSAIADKVALQLNMIAGDQPRVMARGGMQ